MENIRLVIELERHKTEISADERSLQERRSELRAWLGVDSLPESYSVEVDLAKLPDLPDVRMVVERAKRDQPELRSAGWRIRATSARIDAERFKRFPDMSIGGFYDRELDAHNYGVLLSVNVPVWNWNSGGIDRAKARHRSAVLERELTLTDLEIRARRGHTATVQAFAKVDSLRGGVLPKVEETAKTFERMFQIGEIGVMDVLDAQRVRVELEGELLEAYLESQLAYLELIALMGGEIK